MQEIVKILFFMLFFVCICDCVSIPFIMECERSNFDIFFNCILQILKQDFTVIEVRRIDYNMDYEKIVNVMDVSKANFVISLGDFVKPEYRFYRIVDREGKLINRPGYFDFPIEYCYRKYFSEFNDVLDSRLMIYRTNRFLNEVKTNIFFIKYNNISEKIYEKYFSKFYIDRKSHDAVVWKDRNRRSAVTEEDILKITEKMLVEYEIMVNNLIFEEKEEYRVYLNSYNKYFHKEPDLKRNERKVCIDPNYYLKPDKLYKIVIDRFYEITGKKFYSVDEFAYIIKNEFPEYSDVKNSILVSRFINRYPEYKDYIEFFR